MTLSRLSGPLFGLLFSASACASAATLFVAPTGSDSSIACTIDLPCKTIQRAIALAPSGSTIYLRAGTYRESVMLSKPGASGAPFSLAAYACEPVTISGADVVDSSLWSAYSGSVYVAQLGVGVTDISQVLVDGVYLPKAQYPAYQSSYTRNSWLYTSETSSNKSYLRATSLSTMPDTDIGGAGIHLRTQNWFIEDRVVNKYDAVAGQINFNTAADYVPRSGYGFYLDGKRWMLTHAGAQPGWFYDAVSRQLYVWTPDGTSPALHQLEISARNIGNVAGTVTVANNAHYVTISGVRIDAAASNAVSVLGSANFTLTDTTISNSGGSGVLVSGVSSNVVITRNTFQNLVKDAIWFTTTVSTANITDNVISNVATVGSPRNSLAAVNVQYANTGLTVARNTISNTNYLGIRFGTNASIDHNVITDTCQVLADCGAIYTYEGTAGATLYGRTVPFDLNTTIQANIISGTGMAGGAVSARPTYGTPNTTFPAAAVYLDNLSRGVTVTDNVIYGNERGIFFHDGSSNTASNNILFGNSSSQVFVQEDSMNGPGSTFGLVISNNTMVSSNENPPVSIMSSYSPTLASMATFSGNKYAAVRTTLGQLASPATFQNGQGRSNFDWAGWQAVGQDVTGKLDISFAPWIVTSSEGTLISNGNFVSNNNFWSVYAGGGTATIAWSSTCASQPNGCLAYSLKTGVTGSQAQSNKFTIESGKTYMVSFDHRLTSSQPAVTLPKAIVRLSSGTYASLGLYAPFNPVPGQWKSYKAIFTANAASAIDGARLDLQGYGSGNPELDFQFDNVVVKKATIEAEVASRDFFLLTNPSAQSLQAGCPVTGTPCAQMVDSDGAAVSFPVTVQPYGALPVFWKGSPHYTGL